MPVYEYWCRSCEGKFEAVHSVADYLKPTACPSCGEVGEKRIFTPQVVCDDLPGYQSPIDGRWVEGRRARAEDLRRNGCHPYDPADKAFYAKRRAEEDAQLDRMVEETVSREIAAMPPRKREKLAAELDNGLAAEVVRSTPTTV